MGFSLCRFYSNRIPIVNTAGSSDLELQLPLASTKLHVETRGERMIGSVCDQEVQKKEVEEQGHSSSGRSLLNKQMSGRSNCLCSPTTHAGSFRCRYHQIPSLRQSSSVGSNLSELMIKKSTQAQIT